MGRIAEFLGTFGWPLFGERPGGEPSAEVSASSVTGGSYYGGRSTRITSDWIHGGLDSPDNEVRGSHRALVARSREMSRNSAILRRYLSAQVEGVIGPKGITLQSRARSPLDELIEAGWKEWGRTGECTVDGRHSWLDVQRLVVEGWRRDGEAFVRLVPGRGRFGLQLQIIDPDQVDLELNRHRGRNSNEIRMGVEIDGWGRPVAYHVREDHPEERRPEASRTVRIPADLMVHQYTPERPGQTRGVPRAAPVMMAARHLDKFREAAVVNARVGATKAGVLQSSPDSYAAADPNVAAGETQVFDLELNPGEWIELPPGQQLASWTPDFPATDLTDFDRALMRTIASGLDVSYQTLSADLSDTSYASSRTGLLQERDSYRSGSQQIIEHLCRPVFLAWIRWAVTSGALQVAPSQIAEARAHEFRPRSFPWVDPQKDQAAEIMAIEARLKSRTQVVAEDGRDYRDVLKDLQREEELEREMGLADDTDTTTRGRERLLRAVAGGKGETE